MFEYTLASVRKKKDKKKWVFFIITSIMWIFIFTFSTIASIFLFEARLDSHLQILTMLAPPPPPPLPPPKGRAKTPSHPTQKSSVIKTSKILFNTDQNILLPLSNKVELPEVNVDDNVGVEDGVEGGVEGGVVGGELKSVLGGILGGVKAEANNLNLPPPPIQKQVEQVKEPAPVIPKIIRRSEGVIRGNAIYSPAPKYPLLARTASIQGDVEVKILIDEQGNVISAQIISGQVLLQQGCLSAARQWKFKPTLLGNQPVKVQGTLIFRFRL